MNRKAIFVGALVALVAAFAVAVVFYKGQSDGASDRKAALLVRPHAATLGPADARVHIVEFLDPACETCRAFYPFVKQLMAANPGKIRLTVRHVSFHEGVDVAVQMLEASKKQGRYWQTLEAVLATQPQWAINHRVRPELLWRTLEPVGLDLEQLRRDMSDPQVAQNMKQDQADADALRVSKTPEYFVNGRQMSTFGYEQLRKLVQEELARAYP